MSGINTGKVIVGGLVAGVVFNVLDILNGMLIMAEDFKANAVRLGLDPAAGESSAAIATWVVIDFLAGILVVWTYAAMRPRFGPGPKTAAYAGLVIWVSVNLIMFGLTTTGMMTMATVVKMALIQLVITMAGSITGAAVYKE